MTDTPAAILDPILDLILDLILDPILDTILDPILDERGALHRLRNALYRRCAA